jgi:hypothetical protein
VASSFLVFSFYFILYGFVENRNTSTRFWDYCAVALGGEAYRTVTFNIRQKNISVLVSVSFSGQKLSAKILFCSEVYQHLPHEYRIDVSTDCPA